MRVVEYDPSRRRDVADLMGRVWGERPTEEELGWFYERNPVRPASVLIAEDGGRTAGSVAISFQRMSIGGEQMEVGMPVRLATDPDFRGRGVFSELEEANEERVRELGIRLLLVVPNAASEPILAGRLGWKKLPPVRVWARPFPRRLRPTAATVDRFDDAVGDHHARGDRVLRNGAWLNWRFADSPACYTLLAGGGYAVVGKHGRFATVAALDGDLLADAAAVADGPALLAAPPPGQRGRYLRAGYLPTHRTFTVLGKRLDPAVALPARPHFELGDLDFL
ncbi:MAG TPA: GNAT family N-acetyltransferase [Gaiellaceae bacterium]|nr:GNAT family N-acetyltransferase [Gaiellaceae bacterium]